jgi:error-prone DNA polymerase
LGLQSVRGLGAALAAEIASLAPYRSLEDLVRRVPSLQLPQLEAMATAGVFEQSLRLSRREALWAVGAAVQSTPDRLEGMASGVVAPRLPGMDPLETSVADLWATGIDTNGHPTRFLREALHRQGVVVATALHDCTLLGKVLVAGVVTHRQRPSTAGGTVFLNLEDETGLVNVVVSKGCWARYERVAIDAAALMVRGRLERNEGVVNVIAEEIITLALAATGEPGPAQRYRAAGHRQHGHVLVAQQRAEQ